jgi:hypothetical protein
MAHATAHIHLAAGDAPVVTTLENTPSVALWLTARGDGPAITGSPEQLLAIRRAIGRFLFPEEDEQPADQAEAA